MNHCILQQNVAAAGEEARGPVSMISHQKDPVICPKPRRIGDLASNLIRPLRLHVSHQVKACDSKDRAELLDFILMRDAHGGEQSALTPVASSPPYFFGSPPSRAANPIIQDARFGDDRFSPTPVSPSGSSSPSSARKGGCVRMKFGFKPAAVRVEGFDCLNRDRQNSSIPAVA